MHLKQTFRTKRLPTVTLVAYNGTEVQLFGRVINSVAFISCPQIVHSDGRSAINEFKGFNAYLEDAGAKYYKFIQWRTRPDRVGVSRTPFFLSVRELQEFTPEEVKQLSKKYKFKADFEEIINE